MNIVARYRQRRAVMQEILSLDPVTQHERIVFLTGAYHFPFTSQRSLEFALFRTFAVPSISRLLAATGTFKVNGQKRYDDTALLIAEIAEHGYDSERGAAALQRMNVLHGRYKISNDDYLYVLASFAFEVKRWNQWVGWRKSTRHEELANFYFWRQIGIRMGIQDIPEEMDDFQRFKDDYEREHFRYADTNHQIAEQTIQVFLNWFPHLLSPIIRRGIYTAMDEPLAKAFGYPRTTWIERQIFYLAMRVFSWIVWIIPPRATPFSYTQHPNRSYPDGYTINDLGD